jgi:hypothetical protein
MGRARAEESFKWVSRRKIKSIQFYIEEHMSDIEPLEYTIREFHDNEALASLLDEDLPGYSNRRDKKLFIEDLISNSNYFFNLTSSKQVRIQLHSVENTRCPLFHVDNIKQRLLCTYKGLGTEFLSDDQVMREGLCSGDNEKVVKDFSKILKAQEFDLLILKGLKHHEGSLGAVHRSPEIDSRDSGQRRLILKIDEL